MEQQHQQETEKKNRRVAMLTTIGVQAIFVFLSFIVIGWRAPDPPWGDPSLSPGVEVNFGLDDEGFGDVQPDKPVGDNGDQKESAKQPEKAPEEVKQPEPQPEETKPEVTKATASEDKTLASNDEESPVSVKEKKEEVKKPVEKPVEKKVEPKIEPKVEAPKETKPKLDTKAVYKPSTTQATDGTGSGAKEGQPGNHGDDEGKVGDKGNPQGSLDAKALYGTPGGGGGGNGSSLELSGWTWSEKPAPNVPNNESGRLVFQIKVDENGDVIDIKTLERSVSVEAEQICRRSVEKLSFNKTGSNVPDISTGRITFVIRAR